MKKHTKLLSVILALVMMFSTVSVAFAGTLNPNNKTKVEDFIKNDNLANVVGQLIDDLNGSKKDITGTVLKFCFMFVDQLKTAAEGKNVTALTDKELAKLLVDWLNASLPEWTKGITEQSWYSTVQGIVGILSLELDLDDVNGILKTLKSVCDKLSNDVAFRLIDGDLKNLNGSALNVSYNGSGESALNVISGLFQWLADNKETLQKVIVGGIGTDKGLSLGTIFDSVLGSTLDDVNKIINNLPTFLTGFIYLLVDGYAEKPDIKENPAGGWGTSDYKAYNADQLLAVALIKLIRNDKKVVENGGTPAIVTTAEANAAISMSFYDLLANNLENLFINYDAANWLNEKAASLIKDLSVTPEIKNVFATNINITNDTLKPVYASAKTNGVLGSVNTLLCVIRDTVLSESAKKNLVLATGDNSKLNDNFKKVCQFILPLMANDTVKGKLGYDFSKFTAAAVKNMELKDMAVALLKLFFKDWFNGHSAKFSTADVDKAATLEQLGALAVYYTATADWLPFTVNAAAPAAGLKADAATKYILDTGAMIGLGALNNFKDTLSFETTVKENAGYEAIVDEASDWGLNFIKGLPAVIVKEQAADRMPITRGAYDNAMNGGAFYKINVVLNELIDFSFFTNDAAGYDKAPTTFKFDLGLFLTNTLLDNIYNFDLAGVLDAFKKNSNPNNVLNKTVISAVLSIVDRAVTALFKHVDGSNANITASKEDCYKKDTFTCASYDSNNGHYINKAANSTETFKTPKHVWGAQDTSHRIGATCKEKGYILRTCTKCGYVDKIDGITGSHKYTVKASTVKPTCAAQGYDVYKCAVCGQTDPAKHTIVAATGKHTYVNGKCSVCGAAQPTNPTEPTKPTDPKQPTYKLGDVDNDGFVKAGDARLALRRSVNLENYAPGSAEFLACDVDKDGSVKAGDARLILRASVGLEKLG